MTDTELQKNRFLAMGIDIGIAFGIGIVFAVVGVVGGIMARFLGHLISIVGAAVLCGYFLLRDILMKGNSIGKSLMKIRVVSENGGPITMIQCIKRNAVFALWSVIYLVVSIISLIPLLGCIVWPLDIIASLAVLVYVAWEVYTITQEPNGIRWGDKTAGTRVVR